VRAPYGEARRSAATSPTFPTTIDFPKVEAASLAPPAPGEPEGLSFLCFDERSASLATNTADEPRRALGDRVSAGLEVHYPMLRPMSVAV
jgi:hypothetical protein